MGPRAEDRKKQKPYVSPYFNRYLHNNSTMLIQKFQNKAVVYYASSSFITNFNFVIVLHLSL